MNKRHSTVFQEVFSLEQSLQTGSTDFLSKSLATIALKIIFGLSGGLGRGRLEKGWVKIEVGGWKLLK